MCELLILFIRCLTRVVYYNGQTVRHQSYALINSNEDHTHKDFNAQLENSSLRAADRRLKVDVIQAEPEATARRTSSQGNISNQTRSIQAKQKTE